MFQYVGDGGRYFQNSEGSSRSRPRPRRRLPSLAPTDVPLTLRPEPPRSSVPNLLLRSTPHPFSVSELTPLQRLPLVGSVHSSGGRLRFSGNTITLLLYPVPVSDGRKVCPGPSTRNSGRKEGRQHRTLHNPLLPRLTTSLKESTIPTDPMKDGSRKEEEIKGSISPGVVTEVRSLKETCPYAKHSGRLVVIRAIKNVSPLDVDGVHSLKLQGLTAKGVPRSPGSRVSCRPVSNGRRKTGTRPTDPTILRVGVSEFVRKVLDGTDGGSRTGGFPGRDRNTCREPGSPGFPVARTPPTPISTLHV